jgi:hypothetical protein
MAREVRQGISVESHFERRAREGERYADQQTYVRSPTSGPNAKYPSAIAEG